MHIEEVIVVEGEHDRDRVQKAVQADVIVTGGSRIRQEVYQQLDRVANIRGLIILTDPDFAGEQIRRKLAKRYPDSKHAYLPQKRAIKNGDIGIENAPLEEIASALSQVRHLVDDEEPEYSMADMVHYGLIGILKRERAREREIKPQLDTLHRHFHASRIAVHNSPGNKWRGLLDERHHISMCLAIVDDDRESLLLRDFHLPTKHCRLYIAG